MFKSKIFNSVMRYMLVAMLALLPNAIWGENVFLNDVHKVNINLCDIMWKNNAFAYDYALIYFKDKDGNQVSLDNFGLARWGNTSSEYISNVYNSGNGVKKVGNYYMFSQKDYTWGNQEKLYNFTFFNTVLDLSGYQIIFKASNTNDFESDKETSDITITYQLYSQSDIDAVTFTKATDPTSVKSAYALKEGNKCIFSASSIYDEIKSILGVSSKEDIKDFYIRWTIKHTDGSKVDNLTVSSGKIQKRNDFDYIYFNNTGSSIQAKDLDVTLELPSGESWDNIKLSFVISKNISELTTQYGIVEKEPSLNALYKITLETKYSMPFNHYVGHANTALDENGMQQTAEWEYYVYVKEASEEIELVLPFDEYENSGKDLEPQGYFRWYDLKTDLASNNLRQNSGTKPTLLNSIISGGKNYGLFAYKLQKADRPCSDNIGVTYKAPAEASSEGWAGEDIACDVSRYIDGLDATKTYLEHEPTLSIRYIFHIRSAKQLADDIMNTAIGKNSQRAGYRTYEDGKYLTVGMKDQSSTVTLRLDLSDAKKYYFHPLADGVYKQVGAFSGFTNRVYYVDEKDKLVESNFDKTKLYKATKVEWWAYDKTKTYCRNLGSETNRFFDLKMNKLNGTWMPASLSGSDKNFTFEYGDPVFIVAYAMDEENHRCPIANFDVRFMNNHPMTKEEIAKEGLNNRLISYLEEHYKMATKPITFDDDDVEQTVAAPTTPNNNQDRLPSKWDRRAYSFVYRDLIDCDASWWNNLGEIGHSPLHGDYCLYKSANVPDISGVANGSPNNGYLWWTDGKLYDKTYEMTNGSQYGHFLYVDASDESRKIAAADFTADLCTGQQLIFIAGVADMTHQTVKPQIMFKLYGVKRNVNGDIVDKHLIHNFSSGNFGDNVDGLKQATWYQVYGKITLQKESNVEQYSDFRLEIDNYCNNTQGADYAIDDIRMYLAPAKVQVIQEKPICDGAATGNIKLKIRAIHETLNAITGHKGQTKIYFRFVDEDGKPVEGTDESNPYYRTEQVNTSDGTKIEYKSNKYGAVDVFDSEGTCNQYTIDGTPMIEKDSEGETYIVISNRYYPLKVGKKYYVSVATETPDPVTGKANWGTPAEVCSLYSSWFEMVSQHPVITDTDGKIVSDYKIPCDAGDDYEIKIKGQLVTTDPNTGGKITLDGVKFFWYLDGKDEGNKIDPSAPASNEIPIKKKNITLGKEHEIYMLPEGPKNSDGYIEYAAPNGKTYLLCPGAIPVPLRVMLDGPQLNFGFNDVGYPFKDGSYEASLRIGLPQLEKLKVSKGYLKVPLHSATMRDGTAITEPLTFIDDSSTPAVTSNKVIVASTNDPLWETKLNTQVATLEKTELPAFDKTTQSTLNLKFEDDAVAEFHEGYYYVLRFAYKKRAASAATTNCPGESYLKLKIVPEFVTWTPTADGGMNANWNNDDNWHRSSSTELYDNEYKDYLAYGSSMSGTPTSAKEIPTLNSYVPMKFTKVTIGNLNGLPFPDLGNVVYRSTNQIATKLTNGKGNEATKYIQYDIMAFWNEEDDANKGLEAGNMKCEKFYGNTCHQIYFKPQGELRDQCYLVYDKAWVEKELEPNKWYTMASPLQYIYAGDMYVPASDGQQTTKAFTDIKFDDKVYSRSKYPVYQRAWMKSDVMEISPKRDYPASHYPSVATQENVDMNLGYWSHVYNKVDESYADAADGTFGGFSIKAGNALLPKRPTDSTKKLPNALLRLPKADTSYQYYDYDGTTTSGSKKGDVIKPDVSAIVSSDKNSTGHGKLLVAFNNDEKHLAEKTQSLGADNNSGFYLVANPYTCSISMTKFFEANTGLQKAIWIVEKGDVKAISSTEPDKQNYAIQPTQSFFVKKDDATVTDVRFTSTMCIDRTITPGLLMASDLKSIEATTENSNGQTSRARIALRPEASADYDDQEDVDLLYDQNLKDIPQVYTVAGNEAVAVNAVPELSWIPLGIVSQQAEEVSLTLKGVNKLDAPVYLYDAASANFTEVHDGEAVKVKAGDHGRYFLTQTRTSTGIDRMEAEEQSAPVKVYSPAAGMIVVSALGGEKLDRVQVFTLDGKMVHSYQLPDKQRMILRVPSGVYIVKASTQSCAQAKGQKIAVR